MNYCSDVFNYQRFKTREVKAGRLGIGGDNPIRIQSMTTTNTLDTRATVEQCIRMIKAGCELVRITAPSIREAENLRNIRDELRMRGYDTPLAADIHYTPKAAEIAATIVEKVRINPGNYADKKRFETIDYNDESYLEELERIRRRFTPLIKICKSYGTAMRIGTNHGSLSDRILSRYGDTPEGMVESAMEFLRICETLDYHDIVLSMKASNPKVMIEAYRLLVAKMMKEGMNYPLHLGVTEAGEGEDGRIKSAVGIGTLLEDGLGDTIRVSLTEEPEAEMPVAALLAGRYENRSRHEYIQPVNPNPVNPFVYEKQHSDAVLNIGGNSVPRVIIDVPENGDEGFYTTTGQAGYRYHSETDKWEIADAAADYLRVDSPPGNFSFGGMPGLICPADKIPPDGEKNIYPLYDFNEWMDIPIRHLPHFVVIEPGNIDQATAKRFKNSPQTVLVLQTSNLHAMPHLRSGFMQLINHGVKNPVIIRREYPAELSLEAIRLYAATDCGGLLNDGLGQGIWISAPSLNPEEANNLAFGILQATRTRISRTDYISCPSCGRTLFDLQSTTARIRKRTEHLKGLKIGIMGCIVNGPGEMADADYGYVGSGPGVITLYKEKEIIRKNIPAENAVDELIALIKKYGDWTEPTGT